VGVVGLGFLLAAEIGLGVWLRGVSVAALIAERDPVSGAAYALALVAFALMPALVSRQAPLPETGIDRFIPGPDVSECHEIRVRAPADVVFDTAERFDLHSIPLVHAVFRLREIVFRVRSAPRAPQSLVDETLGLGWGTLLYRPGRERVMGAVTRPWEGNVRFRAVPPAEFAGFAEPGLVKIAWTFEVDPCGVGLTRFRTQTRVLATDPRSRWRFRLYWTFAGRFIVLIRILANRAIRREAEGRARRAVPQGPR
jgi:hypothetical protein